MSGRSAEPLLRGERITSLFYFFIHSIMDTNSILTDAEIRNFLTQKSRGHDIAAAVAWEALDTDEPKTFFDDLLRHGCISGMASSMIYYRDTHAFFDRHYREIEDIRQTFTEQNIHLSLIQGDLKNFCAWMAFEEIAYQLAGELALT
jgi:hypothetical protein